MVDSMIKCLGIVTTAAKMAGIDRVTHYKWMNSDPEYARMIADVDNIALDFAESKLHKKIEKGDTIATIFYLKTKGKKRGYIERVDHDHTTGGDKLPAASTGPVTITIVEDKGPAE